jgi:thioredoxin-related protein
MFTLLGSFALACAVAPAPTDGGRWFADYDEAAKVAIAEKKDLLVDFTGSDWCGWCIKLHDEVFEHEAFYAEAEKHYVLVALDFPQAEEIKAKVPNPERNRELSQKYGVRGFPTVLLMTPEGVVFAQTGYQRGGPEEYIKHLGEISSAGKEALAKVGTIAANFRSAKDEAGKLSGMGEVLSFLEKSEASTMLLEPLFAIARESFALDAENKHGLALRALETLLAKGQWDLDLSAAAAKLDTKNEKGLIEKCLTAQIQQVQDDEAARAFSDTLLAFLAQGLAIQDKSAVAMLAGQAARWNAEEQLLNNPEAALTLAQKALELAPESEDAESLKEMISGLREKIGAQG